MADIRWESQGCELCRRAVFYEVPESPYQILGEAQGGVVLARCRDCGAYWDQNAHDAHVISLDQARASFPDATLDEQES